MDRGLIVENLRSSLAKLPGRTGILGYWPLDRDLAVWIKPLRRSNLERRTRIGRRRCVGGDGGGGTCRRRIPAAASSPETPNPALRVSIRPGLGSVGIYAACASLWRQKRGSAGLGRGSPRRGAVCAAAHRRRARAGVAGVRHRLL